MAVLSKLWLHPIKSLTLSMFYHKNRSMIAFSKAIIESIWVSITLDDGPTIVSVQWGMICVGVVHNIGQDCLEGNSWCVSQGQWQEGNVMFSNINIIE